jgi:hypothetical protein
VNVYYSGKGGFDRYGGTSVATPVIAGMLSNLIQTFLNSDIYTTTPYRYITTVADPGDAIISIQEFMYKIIYPNSTFYASCFNDIKIGTDGPYSAATGFDLPTGLGSIKYAELESTAFDAFNTGGGGGGEEELFTSMPTSGPMNGGTKLTITGIRTNFISKKTVVKINNVLCTKVTVLSATSLTCITPKNNTVAGAKNMTINVNNGNTITLTDGYTYNPFPRISSIYPFVESLNTPLTNVTITGTGFLTGAKVLFGSVASKSVSVVNSTTITALPPRPVTVSKTTKVAVQVTNLDKQSFRVNNAFTYSKPRSPTSPYVLKSLFSSLKRIEPTVTSSIPKLNQLNRVMIANRNNAR